VGKPSLYAEQPYAKAEDRVFLLVPAYSNCPRTKAVKRLMLLLFVVQILYLLPRIFLFEHQLINKMLNTANNVSTSCQSIILPATHKHHQKFTAASELCFILSPELKAPKCVKSRYLGLQLILATRTAIAK